MVTATVVSNSSVSAITNQCVLARARVGSNGSSTATDEVTAGHDASNSAGTRKVWDANLLDSLDSGWVSVDLKCEKNGGSNGVKWTVAGASSTPLVYNAVSYSGIGIVRVRAAVEIGAAVSWNEIRVSWYRNGRLFESYFHSTTLNVDTLTSPGPAETILTLTPESATYDKVVVTAQIRLVCPEETFPESDDLLADIFVDAATCTLL